ncbi:MAG: molecular chaperone DnaJ [Flavobacterium sp.]|uniref:KTSC domain-containing protein n=1 Tax=Flavobacterium sp. TaxID=239 RepID=UPI000C69D9B8|nr:KTSC domain-containing protein [Flavobacterium sp.]MBF01721.1 molecular chaperone DnaJ [Flavobacterium sp.]|tara:strand:+ start:443 stop:889 length:447 start_codon:yes stop_codon:yes gene_type:complete
MKKIVEYRKLLNVTKDVTLSELKSIYRTTMKENHPDKFTDEEKKKEVEAISTLTIEAYHFLVSIANETLAKDKDMYVKTTSSVNIEDFYMENSVLYIQFLDGNRYEYFGVPKNTYIKMINAESPSRFARRHIYGNFLYRSATKLVAAE